MNKEIKKKWLDALKSGNYKRVSGNLVRYEEDRTDKPIRGHCCLGVLCDLYAKDKGVNFFDVIDVVKEGLLPDSVVHWAEIDIEKENFIVRLYGGSLAERNDSAAIEDKTYNVVISTIEERA